jgi:hypothetical protein
MRRSKTARHRVYLLIAIAVLLSAASGRADPKEGLVDRVVRLSGTAPQMKLLGRAILSAVPAEIFAQPGSEARVRSVFRKSFSEDAALDSVRRALEADLDREKIERVADFYRSKLGRRIGRLTGRALTPALLTEVRESRNIVKRLSETRLAAIEQIVRVERVVEFNIRLQTAVVKGLIEGSAGKAAQDPARIPEIRRNLAEAEKKIRAGKKRTWNTAVAAFAYTFRSLNDEELEEFISYLESDAASWFRTAVQRGMERAVNEASTAVGRIIAERNPSRAVERKPGRKE